MAAAVVAAATVTREAAQGMTHHNEHVSPLSSTPEPGSQENIVGTGLGRGVVGRGDGRAVGRAVGTTDGAGSGTTDGAGSGTGVGAHTAGSGSNEQHGVPMLLLVVTAHSSVTPLERACTSVGRSEQILVDHSSKRPLIFVRRPSCVGTGPVISVHISTEKTDVISVSAPNSDGIVPVKLLRPRNPLLEPPVVILVSIPSSVGIVPVR